MPNRSQIVAAAFALLIVKDLVELPFRRKYHEIVGEYNTLATDHNALVEDMSYLIHKINESDIVLDEFDLIVLNKVTKQS